jgi:hypothetical protein
VLSVVVISAALAASALAADADKKKVEKPKALEYVVRAVPPPGSNNMDGSTIIFKIDRFTTPEEKTALLEVLSKDGQSAAMTKAQHTPIGRVIPESGLGANILYAAQEVTEKGTRFVIVSERFQVYEGTIMNADLMKLPFTVAWFIPDSKGRGTGKIYGASSITMDKTGTVDVAHYGPSTADLADIKAH